MSFLIWAAWDSLTSLETESQQTESPTATSALIWCQGGEKTSVKWRLKCWLRKRKMEKICKLCNCILSECNDYSPKVNIIFRTEHLQTRNATANMYESNSNLYVEHNLQAAIQRTDRQTYRQRETEREWKRKEHLTVLYSVFTSPLDMTKYLH